MKFRQLFLLLPLFSTLIVGCGREATTVVEPTTEVSPSEAETQSEDYEKEMSKMNN